MKRLAVSLLAGGTAVALARGPHLIPYETLAADLDTAVGGERHVYQWRHGAISYRTAGSGEPLVLIHGINAAASTYEIRKNFTALAGDFRVFAPDLLGFGLSDRPDVRYTAEIYVDLLRDFLRDVVGSPAHLVASSLSSAYAVSVAQAHRELVRTLVVICPTGIEHLSGPPSGGQRLVDALFGLPLVGRQLFAWLISRPSVRYFQRSMTYHDQRLVTAEMVDLLHHHGQRPGARYAPQGFVGGRLNLQIGEQFADLPQPVVIVWGKNATTTPLGDAPAFLERNPRATLKVFDSAALVPHDEQSQAFNRYVTEWIREQHR